MKMGKIRKLLLLLLAVLLVGTVYNGSTAYASGSSATATQAKVKTGLRKVNGKYYYYDSTGHKAAGKNYNGILYIKKKGTTYYLNEHKVVEAYRIGDTYYHPSGKEMSDVTEYNYKTLQTARKIVAKITTDKMTKAQKLRVCYDWVKAKYYSTPRTFRNTAGWPAVYANDHFLKGHGDCHSDAGAVAYLAKAIGYTDIYVCNDSKGAGHSWCEIGGRVYDPLFCQMKGKGGYTVNFGGKYTKDGGSYRLYPILHIAI